MKQNNPQDFHPQDLYDRFPRLDVALDPPLDKYSWEEWHEGFLGGGGLFLVDELARRMRLRPGMRVLDLACGNAPASIYLAREYGVQVTAGDRVDPSENWQRVRQSGVAELVTPLQMDARMIPFPPGYFDAVLCMNAYFYFGTDDLYLLHLTRHIRPGGKIGIASPCYRRELTPADPPELLYDEPPYYVESRTVHSPGWWREKFSMFALFDALECEEHPLGQQMWQDDTRRLLELSAEADAPEFIRQMAVQTVELMRADVEQLNTYLTIVATVQRQQHSTTTGRR